jgi:G6PDH family F420-dependent oxidoreductase
MLEEAVEVIRRLLSGERVTHHGTHYTVEDARIYSLPETPVEIPVSAFGAAALRVAARIGDGFVTTQPDADALRGYRELGGRGPAMAGAKACWAADREQAVETAYRLWPNTGLPGELAQVLPSPAHFEQASRLVTPEMIGGAMPCGPDVEEHVEKLRAYEQAGYDELYVAQIGPDQDGFFEFYSGKVLPALRRSTM